MCIICYFVHFLKEKITSNARLAYVNLKGYEVSDCINDTNIGVDGGEWWYVKSGSR